MKYIMRKFKKRVNLSLNKTTRLVYLRYSMVLTKNKARKIVKNKIEKDLVLLKELVVLCKQLMNFWQTVLERRQCPKKGILPKQKSPILTINLTVLRK